MQRKSGFTLIELSIVIVIIGLIVGGVLLAQDLIRASQLRSIITDQRKFQIAVNTFKMKYNCIPGDCNKATGFWSGTANGDGNKIIYNREKFRFWQQLTLSELLEGSYTGLSGPVNSQWDMVPGVNGPSSVVHNEAVWSVREWDTLTGITNFEASYVTQRHIAAKLGHVYVLGQRMANYGNLYGVITGEEAQLLDEKFDDGGPITGQILVTRRNGNGSYNAHCHNARPANATTAEYEWNSSASDYNEKIRMCNIVFRNAF